MENRRKDAYTISVGLVVARLGKENKMLFKRAFLKTDKAKKHSKRLKALKKENSRARESRRTYKIVKQKGKVQ